MWLLLNMFLLVGSLQPLMSARQKRIDILQPLKFGNCDDSYMKKSNYSYFENVTIVAIGKGINAINGDFVNMYAAEKTTATYKMYKCTSQLTSDCDVFGSYWHKDFCATATEEGQYYSTMFLAFHPHLTCPLKRMTYKVENATVDVRAILNLAKLVPGVRSYYWMTETKIISLPQRKEFACMMSMFKYLQIKV